jgi:hypothetical protein
MYLSIKIFLKRHAIIPNTYSGEALLLEASNNFKMLVVNSLIADYVCNDGRSMVVRKMAIRRHLAGGVWVVSS